jgi:hypothetical protein
MIYSSIGLNEIPSMDEEAALQRVNRRKIREEWKHP